MKKIETLIQDIHSLFTSSFTPKEEDVEIFGKKLARHILNRISEERGPPKLRVSNAGMPCERKLWATINIPEKATPLSGETRLKFLVGDVWEEVILFLAKLSGHKVEREQEEIEIQGIKGHIDGFIDDVLVDVKSASKYSFEKFREGLTKENDSFGYLTQLGIYKYATKANEAAFIPAEKTMAKLHISPLPKDRTDYDEFLQKKKEIVSLSLPPPRGFSDIPDSASGNRRLDVVCEYCDFKSWCWPGLRVFAYAGKPKYLTVVKLLPKVPEFVE